MVSKYDPKKKIDPKKFLRKGPAKRPKKKIDPKKYLKKMRSK